MCRHVFFHIVDEDKERRYHHEVIRRVGLPPQEGHAQGDTPTPRWPPSWFGWFIEDAAEQYQESLILARRFLARQFTGRDEVEREERFRNFYSSQAEMDDHIANQATAYRTLPLREYLLYLQFVEEGVFPRVEGPISGPLDAEQLEALFQELQRRGAFDPELHPFPRYEGRTDREMWLLHLEEGEMYVTWEGGYWSLSLD